LTATIWYSPSYWWQILWAPSFAGKPLFKVIGQLGQLLPLSLAIGLAVFSGKNRIVNRQSAVVKFCFYWLFIFGFLSLVRFISDPDFWLDWSAYGLEIQLGLAVFGGLLLNRFQIAKRHSQGVAQAQHHLRDSGWRVIFITVYCLLFTVVFKNRVLGTLQKNITKSVEYKIGQSLSKTLKPGERVFLSGSSVFWLNAFFDIHQMRGGVDRAAVHPTWRKAAWEIREGKKAEKTLKWLKDLNVSWLVVHGESSKEFYHDFKYPEKFEGIKGLNKVYDKAGDRIYKLENN
jgi:hypothetical protein